MKITASELQEKVLAGVLKLGYKGGDELAKQVQDSSEIEIADALLGELVSFVEN